MKYRLGLILLALAFIISGCGAKKSQELPPLQPGWEQITSAGKVVIALPEGAYDAESIENSHEDGFDIEVQIFDSAPTDWELPMIGVVEVTPPFWYGWAFRLFDDWGNQEVRKQAEEGFRSEFTKTIREEFDGARVKWAPSKVITLHNKKVLVMSGSLIVFPRTEYQMDWIHETYVWNHQGRLYMIGMIGPDIPADFREKFLLQVQLP